MPESFRDDFLLYWGLLASGIVATGRLEHGRSWDKDKLDRLTLGLDRHCRRNLVHLPGAIRRLRRSADLMADLATQYDVLLTPTLACETPEVGWLDPMQEYDVVLERLLQWVAYTPDPERRGRAGRLAAAGDHGLGPAPGDDALRRARPRGPAPRARLRARGGPALAAPARRLSHA